MKKIYFSRTGNLCATPKANTQKMASPFAKWINIAIISLAALMSGMNSWGQTTVATRTTAGNGTVIVPAGVSKLSVELTGAGGGGGSNGSFSWARGSGGAGGTFIKNLLSVSAGTYNYTVGAGGASATVGSNSFFGNTTAGAQAGSSVIANGGAAGISAAGAGTANTAWNTAAANTAVTTGSSPASGNAALNVGTSGSAGTGTGVSPASLSGVGGAGAGYASSSAGGAGATAVSYSNPGLVGTAPGGGGSGGIQGATAATLRAGGAGGVGKAVITYYVVPTVSSLSVTSGVSGTSVTVTGTNFFTGLSKITVDGTEVTTTYLTATTISANITGSLGARSIGVNNSDITATGFGISSSTSTLTFNIFINYYSKSTGNLEILSNWGTNADGTGTAPSNFTSANQVFNIRNNASPTIGAAWTVSGTNAKIIVGDGTNGCNFTIPSTNAVTGTIDVAASATLTLQTTTANLPTLGSLSGTVVYQPDASATVAVAATLYANLTLNAANSGSSVTLPSGTVSISGTFNPGTVTSASQGTIDYNGTGAQTIAAFDYNSLTTSGARTTNSVTLASSGTIGVAVTFTASATFTTGAYINTGSTVDFKGVGSQTIPAINYNNLSNSGNGARTLASVGTVGIAGTFSPGSGAYTTTSSTVSLNGISQQSIPALSSGTYNNITISNSAGVTTPNILTIGGTTTLTAGALILPTGLGNLVTFTGAISATSGTITGSTTSNISTGSVSTALSFTTGGRNLNNLTTTASFGSSTTIGLSSALSITGTLTLSGTNDFWSTSTGSLTILSGGTFDEIANGWYRGSGALTISSGATFKINDASGLMADALSGAVRATGTLTFSGGANYIFNNSLTQAIGTALDGAGGTSKTGAITGNVTVTASIGCTLTSNMTINTPGTFTLGVASTSSAVLIASSSVAISGTGNVTFAGNGATSGSTLQTAHANGVNGTIQVSGTTSLTNDANNNTNFTFNGTVQQTTGSLLPATLNNFNSSNTFGGTFNIGGVGGVASLIFSNSTTINGTFTIAGGNAPAGLIGIGAGNTLTCNGAITISSSNKILGSSTSSLIIGGAGTITAAKGLFATGGNSLENFTVNRTGETVQCSTSLTISGTFSLTAGIFNIVGNTLNLNGPLAFGSGTLTTDGTGPLTVGGSGSITGSLLGTNNPLAFTAITMNRSATTLTLGSNTTVSNATGTTLTAGYIALGSFNLTNVNATASSNLGTGSSASHVIATGSGKAFNSFITGATTIKTFPIGDGTNYTPATLTFSANTVAGTVGASVKAVVQPNYDNSGAQTNYISRYWSFTNTGLTTYTYRSTFTYVAGDIHGDSSLMKLNRWSGAAWSEDATSSATAYVLTSTAGLTESTFPLSGDHTGRKEFIAANYTWVGGTSNDWADATNWSPNGVPVALDNVTIDIPGSFTNCSILTGSKTITSLTLNGTGAFAMVSGTSLTVSGAITYGGSATTNLDAASTINMTSTSSQTVPAMNFGNLNTTNGARVLASSGTIGIAGTFTPGSGGFTTTGSTIEFNGSGSQAIPAFSYNNLTSSSTGARTLASTGTIAVAGTFTPGTNTYTNTGSTINFNGAGAQTVAAFASYNNLTISGARSAATVTLASGTIGVAGAFTASATSVTYSSTGNTFDYTSAGSQTITGFNKYNNLSNSGNGARTLSSTPTIVVDGTYTPTSGAVTVGTSTIDFSSASTQTMPATFYYNVTNSGNGARTWASSGTIDINAGFSPTTATNTITGSTLQYSSTAASTFTMGSFTTNVANRQYNNLILVGGASTIWQPGSGFNLGIAGNFSLTGSGTFNVCANTTANTVTVDGNFLVGTSAGKLNVTASSGAGTLNVTGNFTQSGTGIITVSGGTGLGTANITGNVTISNGTMNGNAATTTSKDAYINVGGTYLQTGGTVNLQNNTSTAVATTTVGFMQVTGDFTLTAGTFEFATTGVSTASSNWGELDLKGNFIRNGAANTLKGTGSAYNGLIYFIGTLPQTINVTTTTPTTNYIGTTILSGSSVSLLSGFKTSVLTVNTGGTLMCGTNLVSNSDLGGGSFTNNGTLGIGDAAGITAAIATATGNIRSTTARTFSTTGNYNYNGTTAQVTGTGLPATVNNLTINNASNVTLSQALSVAGTLAFTTGSLDLGTFNLTLNGTVSGFGAGKYVKTSSTGLLTQTLASNTQVTFPVGNSGYNPITISQSGSSDSYSLRVLDGAISGINPNDVTLTIDRRWSFTRTSTANVNITVNSVSYNVGEENNATNFNAGTQPYYGLYTSTWVQATATQSSQTFTSANALASSTSTSFSIGLGKDVGLIAPILTYTWVGGTSGDWGTAANWDLNTVPYYPFTDVIIIPTASSYTNALAITGTKSCGSFTVNGNGIFSMAASSSLTVYNDFSYNSSAAATFDCSSTLNIASSSAQTVPALDYGNLNLTGGIRTLASSGIIGVCGTFTQGAGGFTVTGSTINFNGSSSQTIPAFNYNNLTSSSSGARILASSGIIGVAGTFTPGSNSYTNTGSTIDYNSASTQTITAFNYNNITNSGNGARTLDNSGTVGIAASFSPGSGAYTVTGSTVDYNGTAGATFSTFTYNNLTLSNNRGGGTLSFGTGTITIGGTLVFSATNVTQAAGTGTVVFNSTGSQTIPALNYYNLNTSGGARTLASSGTINIAGTTFTPGSGPFTVTGSTVNFSNATGLTIPALTAAATNNYNDLTISGAGTYSFAGSVTLAGNYVQNAAATVTLNNGATAYNLTAAGNFSISAGTFALQNTSTGLGSTVTINGATGTTISGTGGLYMDNGGAAVGNVSIFQTTNFTASSSSTTPGIIDFGNSTSIKNNEFRISGNCSKTGTTGRFNTAASVVNGGLVFNGSGSTQTVSIVPYSATEYYNVTVNSNAVVKLTTVLTLGASTVPTSTMTVNGTLDCQALAPAVNGGATNGTFVLAGTLITANTVGVVSTTLGSISTSIGTRTFNTIANYTFNGTAGQTTNFPNTTMNNLTIANTNASGVTLTDASSVTVNGTLTLTSNPLKYGATSGTLALNGPITTTSGSIAGTNAASALTVAPSGTITGALNLTGIFGNFTWSRTTGATLASSFAIKGNFSNSAGSLLDFSTNSITVTMNGGVPQALSGNTTFFNLTISSTGTNLSFGSSTYTIANILSKSGGTMTPQTSTFIFTGASGSIANTSAKIFYNLTINNLASVDNTQGSVTINNIFTNSGTFTSSSSSGTIAFTGAGTSYVNNGTVTMNPATSVNFNSGGSQTLSGLGTSSFGSFSISANTTNTTVDAGTHNFTITGATFDVNSTQTFTGNGNTVTFAGGTTTTVIGSPGTYNFKNVIINLSSTLSNATNSRAINVLGDWTNNGTYTAGTETITFKGAITQTMSGTGTSTFGSVAVGTGVTGTTLNAGSHDFTVTGSSFSVVTSNTFNGGTGTVTFTGGATTTNINAAGTYNFNNVTISSGSTVTNTNNRNLFVSGNWSNAGTYTGGATEVFNFNGGVTQSMSGAGTSTFGSFSVGTGVTGTTLNAGSHNFTVTGSSFNVVLSNTFNGGTGTVTFNGGATTTTFSTSAGTNGTYSFNNVTINASSTLSNFVNNRSLSISGNWTNNGTYTAGATETLTFNGGSVKTIAGTSSTSFFNVKLNGSGVSLGNSQTINGAVTFTAGSFDLNGSNNVTLGATSGNISGETSTKLFINTGSPTAGNGYIQTTRTLAADPGNVANLGVTLTTATAMDVTTIKRFPGKAVTGVGASNSVKRIYSITPTTAASNVTLTLSYFSTELNSNTTATLVAYNATGTDETLASGYSSFYGTSGSTATSVTPISTVSLATSQNNLVLASTDGYITVQNGDWNTAATWSSNSVPPAGTATSIKHGVTIGSSAVCSSLKIASGSNLTISGSNTLTFTDLSNAGTITADSSTLSIGGTFTNTGTFNAGTGTLDYTGAAQTVAGVTYNNLTLSGSGTKTVGGNMSVGGALDIGTGVTMALDNYTTTLKSNAQTTASVKPVNGSITYGTGKFIIERFLQAASSWRLMATPITSGSSPTISEAWREGEAVGTNTTVGLGTRITGPTSMDEYTQRGSMKYYNMANNTYVDVNAAALALPIQKDQGYYVFVRGDRTVGVGGTTGTTNLRTAGQLRTGDQTFSVVKNLAPAAGFQSVGNPYASRIDVRNFILSAGGVAETFYIWNPTGGYYGVGQYENYTKNGGDFKRDGSGAVLNSIESGQAFFLQNNSTTTDGSITIKETDKVTGSSLVSRIGVTTPTLEIDLFTNNATGVETRVDGATVNFDANYANTVDNNDVRKITNTYDNVGLKQGTANLVVERRNTLVATDTLRLNMTGMRVASYKFKIDPSVLGNLPLNAFLVDKFLLTETPVSLTAVTSVPFSTTSDAASRAADRFKIVFRQGVLPVTFTAITASVNTDKTHTVKWFVSNEVNLAGYVIERSANGVRFDAIGNSAVAGNTAYSFIDTSPLAALNYYRVKATSANGQVQYSAIVKLSSADVKPSFSIQPNPVENKTLHISFENMKGLYSMRLTNKQGAMVFTKQINVASLNEVQHILMDGIAAGVYDVVLVNAKGNQMVQTIIIQ